MKNGLQIFLLVILAITTVANVIISFFFASSARTLTDENERLRGAVSQISELLSFDNLKDLPIRRYSTISYISIGEGWGGFVNETYDVNVRVGTDSLKGSPCGAEVGLTSSRPSDDLISPKSVKAECYDGTALFKIKSSSPGISTIRAFTKSNELYSEDFYVFERRSDGTLIRPEGHPAVFILNEGKKYHISNASLIEEFGYNPDQIVVVDPREEHLYEEGIKSDLSVVLEKYRKN